MPISSQQSNAQRSLQLPETIHTSILDHLGNVRHKDQLHDSEALEKILTIVHTIESDDTNIDITRIVKLSTYLVTKIGGET